MNKTVKKKWVLLVALLSMMMFVACGNDSGEEKESSTESMEVESADENDGNDLNKAEAEAEVVAVAEAYLEEIASFRDEEAKKYVIPEVANKEETEDMEIFELYEDGIYSYDAYGVKYKAELIMKYSKDSLYESSIDELKLAVKGTKTGEIIDYDKVSDVYIYVGNIFGEMTILELEVDYAEAGFADEDIKLFEEEYGMSYEEYMRTELPAAFSEPQLLNIYVAKYDGEWKIAFAE